VFFVARQQKTAAHETTGWMIRGLQLLDIRHYWPAIPDKLLFYLLQPLSTFCQKRETQSLVKLVRPFEKGKRS